MNQLDFSMRGRIIEKCREAGELADALYHDDNRHDVVREQAYSIKKRSKVIEENCSVERYHLYFNGKVGVGKSTAICYLTGQIDKNCFAGGNINDLPLLKTASGRTTVCETRILYTEEQSRIVITKMPGNAFGEYVKEFRDKIYDPKVEVPTEIIRLISNMSGYPYKNGKLQTEEADILGYLEQSGAQSLECTKENLLDTISRNINYDGREKTEFVFSEGRFEDWLKKYMQELNDGKIPDAPFPEKISICVNRRDFEAGIPEYISSIVDTRGIDGNSDSIREDITESVIRKDVISIMCEEIASFGANAHKQLRHSISKGGNDILLRLFLLGLGKANEIENVNGAVDYEQGIESKRNEAIQKMEEGKIPILEGHIDCRNVRLGIKYTSDNEILSVDEAVCQQKREGFWEWLETGLKEMYSKYFAETEELLHSLKCLEKKQVSEEIISKCAEYREAAKKFNIKQVDLGEDFKGKITQVMRQSHAGVVRGCVNRSGSYISLDLYTISILAGGEEFAKKCDTGRDVLLARLEEIFDPEDEIEKIYLDTARREINNSYRKYYNDSCVHYKNCFSVCIGENSIWDRLKSYWGDGCGRYKERVIGEIIEELERQDIAGKLVQKDFSAYYKDDIGTILDVS